MHLNTFRFKQGGPENTVSLKGVNKKVTMFCQFLIHYPAPLLRKIINRPLFRQISIFKLFSSEVSV